MSSLYDSVAEKDDFNSRRSLDAAYEKMKVITKPHLFFPFQVTNYLFLYRKP